MHKLLEARHIWEVQYHMWLTNVVLVVKPLGKCHIYIDFQDLNKACPKDCYSLLRIDQLVDSTFEYQFISMMGAY